MAKASALITNFDGQQSFIFSKQHAPVTTVQEAMVAADLDWKVDQRDLYDSDKNHMEGKYAIVRADNNQVLGFVGQRYTPIHNETAFGILTPALDDKSLEIGRAGYFSDGARVFMQADVIAGKVEVIKGDEVHSRILISTSHDGSGLLIAKSNPTRVICQNTLNAALKGVGSQIKIRHTINQAQEAGAAGEIIAMVLKHHQASMEAFTAMAKKKMTGPQAIEFFKNVLGGRKSKDQAGEAGEMEKEFRAVAQLMHLAEFSPVKAKEGTVWGYYNALTEWVDHRRTASESSRLQGALLDGSFAELKQRAFDLAVAA